MRPILLAALSAVLLDSAYSHPSRCSADQFQISNLYISAAKSCSSCSPRLSVTADVRNGCNTPASPHVKITARTDSGRIVRSWVYEPVGLANLDPGASYAMDFSHERFEPEMSRFQVDVVGIYVWR